MIDGKVGEVGRTVNSLLYRHSPERRGREEKYIVPQARRSRAGRTCRRREEKQGVPVGVLKLLDLCQVGVSSVHLHIHLLLLPIQLLYHILIVFYVLQVPRKGGYRGCRWGLGDQTGGCRWGLGDCSNLELRLPCKPINLLDVQAIVQCVQPTSDSSRTVQAPSCLDCPHHCGSVCWSLSAPTRELCYYERVGNNQSPSFHSTTPTE